MKKWVVYVLGILSGMFLLLFLVFFWGMSGTSENDTGELKMFDEPGECISTNNFKVQKILESGDAIAVEIAIASPGVDITSDLEVLIPAQNGREFYDNQILNNPDGGCVRQIGIYKYKEYSRMKVIPIVSFE